VHIIDSKQENEHRIVALDLWSLVSASIGSSRSTDSDDLGSAGVDRPKSPVEPIVSAQVIRPLRRQRPRATCS
jgi:hypothetical protein